MERNPYSAPATPVADIDPAMDDMAGEVLFFPVSATKLVLMSIVTFGIYELYWFYRNWELYRKRNGADIRPFWRAFFAFFFCYSLFEEIRKQADRHGVAGSVPAGLLTILWIAVSIMWRLPDPYWLISYLAVLVLLPANAVANRVNAMVAPGHATNSGFGAWNIAGLLVGGALLLLVVVGLVTIGTEPY
jgi:Domain of unknown function (DUF4234)